MGTRVTLVDSAGAETFHFLDPAGGFFDAAGDFNRLIGLPGDWLVCCINAVTGETVTFTG